MATSHPALLALALSLGVGCSEGGASGGRDWDAATDGTIAFAGDVPAEDAWSSDIASNGPCAVEAGSDDASTSGDGTACSRLPWILLGQVENARQLGGLPLESGGTVACDLVYRGADLSSLTEEGCDQFATAGIKTVVDLRSESERTSAPDACVGERLRLVLAPLSTPYNVSPSDYLADLYAESSMQTVFATLADRAAYPIYYHCVYGKDRTGVLTAVILSALGASRQVIQDEYALSQEAGFATYPESLNAVLDELDRVGLDAYFQAVGVPPEHVQAMRAILAPGSD